MKKLFVVSLITVFLISTITIEAKEVSNSYENYQYTEEELRQAGGLEKLLENEKLDLEKSIKMKTEGIFSKSYNFYNSNIYFVDNLQSFSDNNIPSKMQLNSDGIGFITDIRSGFFINYPINQQLNIYYCGPASMKNALHIINGSSLSQNTYATSMGTTYDQGTFVYKMVEEFNKRQTKNVYGWRTINNDRNRLWEPVLTDLLQYRVPPIVRVDTKYLWKYNGRSMGHYVTITGYSGWQTPSLTEKLLYADSFYLDYGRGNVFGEYWDTLDNFTQASTHLIW